MGNEQMKNYTNFKESRIEEIENYTLLYMECDQGVDWYHAVTTFAEDTYKLQYDNAGVINSVTRDASRLTPLGYSVIEVAELPADPDVLFSGRVWIVKNGKIVPKTLSAKEIIADATERKAAQLLEAAEVIAPLQDAVDLSMENDEEMKLLIAWKRYRVMLNRIDVNLAPAIDWPDKP